uniref:Inositol-pentakisphosphate 2-kinase n=1 Tax=Elaeophora elaphi TaxID=1147741 RepID=A0A0R3S2W6_9BILA
MLNDIDTFIYLIKLNHDDQIVYYDNGAYSNREDSHCNCYFRIEPYQNNRYSMVSLPQHWLVILGKKCRSSEPSASFSSSIPQPLAKIPLAESSPDSDSTFPTKFYGTSTRVTKQIEHWTYNWNPLLQCLSYTRWELNGLRYKVITVKKDTGKNLEMIKPCLDDTLVMIVFHFPARASAVYEKEKTVSSTSGKFMQVYRYCPKEIVHDLVAAFHPTNLFGGLCQFLCAKRSAYYFLEIEIITSRYYPRKKLSSMHKGCLEALSELVDYENLLWELEKENHSFDRNTAFPFWECSVPEKRMRLDDACSSTYELGFTRNEQNCLLPQTLSRIKRQEQNAEGFAVKVAVLLYTGGDDIRLLSEFKRDQSKEKVQEFCPVDTAKNVNYQWSLAALDTHAKKLRNMHFDEYDSS